MKICSYPFHDLFSSNKYPSTFFWANKNTVSTLWRSPDRKNLKRILYSFCRTTWTLIRFEYKWGRHRIILKPETRHQIKIFFFYHKRGMTCRLEVFCFQLNSTKIYSYAVKLFWLEFKFIISIFMSNEMQIRPIRPLSKQNFDENRTPHKGKNNIDRYQKLTPAFNFRVQRHGYWKIISSMPLNRFHPENSGTCVVKATRFKNFILISTLKVKYIIFSVLGFIGIDCRTWNCIFFKCISYEKLNSFENIRIM